MDITAPTLTTSTSTTTSTTTTTLAATNLVFSVGWTLAGNGADGSLSVPATFGDASKVLAVWKWISASAKWAFYAPSLDGKALADYATAKGYDVLTTVSGGEGVWVNAKTPFAAQLPAGAPIRSASFRSMNQGWNLIAVGDNLTPREFNSALSITPPAPTVIPNNITTLWAWDAGKSNWYFYAPSLDQSGGLPTYITH